MDKELEEVLNEDYMRDQHIDLSNMKMDLESM